MSFSLKQQRDTREEFFLEWALPKAAMNIFGCATHEPVVGYDIRVEQRVLALPVEKEDKYCAAIDDVVSEAGAHSKRLVVATGWDKLMGRLVHAGDVVSSI